MDHCYFQTLVDRMTPFMARCHTKFHDVISVAEIGSNVSFLSDRCVCISPYRPILRSTTLPFSFQTGGGTASLKMGNIFAGRVSRKFPPRVDTLWHLTLKWISQH
jgi:hypothetical protein